MEIMNSFYGNLNITEINYVRLSCDSNSMYGTDEAMVIEESKRKDFHLWMKQGGYFQVEHSEGKEAGFTYLYSMYPVECWIIDGNKSISVFYQFGCHGIQYKTYVPLDKSINNYLWNNRVIKNNVYSMSDEVELIFEIVQCVFHYKEFDEELIKAIEIKKELLDRKSVANMLDLIFFKFSSKLIELVNRHQYNEIINRYITYKEY